ncbi:hypothetical protein [Thermomonas sp. HDW16]|uniref:hypothetical protein n=1 Tax=Thermomonas sp. HDW16 TaxID=2714945 RepID=UPI00140D64FF|nr:hypothetical protein [Thermomonas sp. HDW16]QIL19491.1 hypothetical protein G7079_01370 [Thermomonas sp. HDW16]
MSSNRNAGKTTKARRSRIYKVTPMTRAVRSVLAASTLALALGTGGNAYAGNCPPTQGQSIVLRCENASIDTAPVFDLTTVPHAFGPTGNSQSLIGDGKTHADSAWLILPFGFSWYAPFPVSGSNSGDLHAIHVESTNGSIYSGYNTYAVSATSSGGEAVGIYAVATGSNALNNSGSLTADGYTDAAGIASFGVDDVTVINSGDISATAYMGNAYGVLAVADSGNVAITNSAATINASSTYGNAFGLQGISTDGAVDIHANGNGAINARTYYGDAAGIFAASTAGDVYVYNNTSIDAYSVYGNATGIDAYSDAGSVTVSNVGPINADSVYGNATGINAYSNAGDVLIGNAGGVDVYTRYGSAIGLYGYSGTGNVTINNNGNISAYSYAGLADGIFASGADITITNSSVSTIGVNGTGWAAGIEARGTGTVSVTNNNGGEIYAYAYGAGGFAAAYGIYAAGADATVANSGRIEAQGYYATGIRTQTYGDVSATNDGSIYAGTTTDSALAWGIRAEATGEGAAITIGNSGDITAAAVYGATGIEAVASGLGGTASVTNTGDIIVTQNRAITSYGGYGVLASADGDSTIYNDGGYVDVTSRGPAFGLASNSFAGTASVTNTGDVYATSTLSSSANPSIGATGLLAFSGNGDASVDNSGNVYAHGVRSSTGISASAGADGNATVTNSGDIVATTNVASNARANGIRVAAGNGNIEVENSGSIYASGAILAFGIYSSNTAGDTHLYNTTDGDIEFYSYAGRGFGAFAFAEQGDVNFENAGYIHGYSWQQAYGARVRDLYGDASASNSGYIDIESGNNRAFGLLAVSQYAGTASVSNSYGGYINVVAATGAYGARVYGVDGANADNSGEIRASGGTAAVGVMADSGGETTASNSGRIVANGDAVAIGMLVAGDAGATVTNTGGVIFAYSQGGTATGIDASSSAGDVTVTNASSIYAISASSNAYAVSAYGYGDVVVDNDDFVLAYSGANGNAIGLYAYSVAGNATVTNSGQAIANAADGLADGIFASGADVTIDNSGVAMATTHYGAWAAGIEAQGTGTVSVANSGQVYGNTSEVGAHAYGIYATGADVTVANNGGLIAVSGYYATGIEAQSTGDVSVSNTGAVLAGYSYFGSSELAVGINASSNGEGASVTADNGGDIYAAGTYGGTGIAATASGAGGTASITNTGDIYASQTGKYGYGAYGMVASADGDATVNNDGGTVDAISQGAANGAVALSFAGDASVTNSGDVTARSTYSLEDTANGLVAFAGYGDAHIDNSGTVNASSKYYWATAADARAFGDVEVTNSGSLYADGLKYAFGVYASAGTGDVNVTNEADGDIGFYSYYGRGWGVFGFASQGDVNVTNDGVIEGYAAGQSAGIFGRAAQGDVTVESSGSIGVVSGDNVALGVFARADYGTASVNNSGDITANGGYAAYGVFARGAYADVSNSGDILAIGYNYATGIFAASEYGTTVTNAGGSISVYSRGAAYGIDARSSGGDVTVTNASDIAAFGQDLGAFGISAQAYGDVTIDNIGDVYAYSYDGDATGVYGYSATGDVAITNSAGVEAYSYNGTAIGLSGYADVGDVAITNSGEVRAESYYGLADGIFASGADVAVTSSGTISSYGYTWSAGIEAQGTGIVSVTNSGGIYAVAYDAGAHAYGIYATGADVTVANTGDIEAQGYYATGIEAQSTGDVSVTNDGGVVAGMPYTSALATGINASSNGEGASVTVTSNGDISAQGYYGGTGIAATASGAGGTASITNTGTIYASQYNKYGYGAYGIVASADGDATVDNAGGSIEVYSAGVANGAVAMSFAGDASVTNSGDVTVESTALLDYAASGLVSFAGYGNANIDNSGSVDVTSPYSATAADARAFGDANVTNSGSLYADGLKYAFGVYATAGTGDVNVSNEADGDIGFYSYVGRGWGVFGFASQGDVNVANEGMIEGYAYGQSAGIFGRAAQGDVTIDSSGSIDVTSGGDVAVGAFARADYGTASVNNSGDITASDFPGGDFIGDTAYGIFARGMYADASNSGSIVADGYYYATGIFATSLEGTTVANTGGSITATAEYGATGIDARSADGDVTVTNAGDITATTTVDGTAYGIFAQGIYTDVVNSGTITADGYPYATGIAARSDEGTSVQTAASSQIEVTAPVVAIGIESRSEYGDAVVGNAGDITATANYGAVGVQAYSYAGDVMVNSSGHVDASADSGIALGLSGYSYYGNASVGNSGDVTATGYVGAYGIVTQSYAGDASASNTGSIQASSDQVAAAIFARAEGDVTIGNSGELTADAYAAYGIDAMSYTGNVTITNSGDITATAAAGGFAAAVQMQSVDGQTTLNNAGSGNIHVDAGAYAVVGGDTTDTINNSGDITGSIALYGGNDVINNAFGGTISLVGATIDMGDGDDAVNTAIGSNLVMDGAAIYMAGGSANSFTNAGVIVVRGDTNLIDMGGGTPAPALAASIASAFNQPVAMSVFAPTAVPSLNAIPFINNGTIDFVDGATDDVLTIVGDMGGSGALNIDVSMLNQSADQLYVDGSIVSGSSQDVNLTLQGFPNGTEDPIPFAHVSGNSSASSFVDGQVLGVSVANFLTLGLTVISDIDTTNARDDVFSIGLDVTGLSDAGTLGASLASGAAGFLNSQIGTFRQRLGVNPYGDSGKVMSAFFRAYTDDGDVNPTHQEVNFGGDGNYAYNQTSWGRELGVNANLFGNFHAGVVLGNADSRQRLTGDGHGENRMSGMTWGAYATWYVPQGFYVDLTGRWMAADVRSTTSAGTLTARAHTSAASIEAGYQWAFGNGLMVVPQAQYTRTKVDGISTIHGPDVDFQAHGGTFSRGRLGVELNKAFQVGGATITPYGSVNAIREFDGESTYTIAGRYDGSTGVKGTSTMVELGVGAHKGAFDVTIGANWTDGGAIDSGLGGQAIIRYAW